MKPLGIREIRAAVRGVNLSELREDLAVVGVSTDSRSARAGEIFFAIEGENFDGHRFLAQAADAGCVATVVRQGANLPPDVPAMFGAGVIGVENTRAALGELAAFYRRQCGAAVIAITGSNGKTTVKGMVHHILSRRLKGSASPKSFNNDIGVPLTLLGVNVGDDYVICEIGTNHPGEIASLTRIARPDVAVITSVAETHLEGLGSLEGVATEKAAILGDLERGGAGIVWADSPVLARALRAYDVKLIRFGQSADADLRLTGYEAAGGGCRFELNGRRWVSLALPGRHNALNALAAIAVAQRFGLDQDQAADALSDFAGAQMRLQRIRLGAVTVLNDAYNANPASVAAAAEVLGELPARRRVMIVGDMKELGPRGEQLHRDTGERIARAGVDLLIAVGTLGRYVAQGAAGQGLRAECFETVEAACAAAPALLTDGDVILLKGSRAMAMERLLEPIRRAFEADSSAGAVAAQERRPR